MGHGNLSPRQKMINMMYLVLTALLALNVSAEILNAFLLIDDSLVKTTKNIQTKNDAVYAKFEALMAVPTSAIKAKPWQEKSLEVKKLSEDLISFIQSKQELIVETAEAAEGLEKYKEHGTHGISKKDDTNTPAQIMILEGGGAEFKTKLGEYVSALTSIIESSTKGKNTEIVQTGQGILKNLKSTFNTEDVKGTHGDELIPWEEANFEHIPLVAVITMLDKFKTDIKNAESEMAGFFISQVEAGTWKFNKLEAIVNPEASYILAGDTYKAQVFIAASDSTQTPNILVGGKKLKIENGKGIYTASGGVGEHSWKGVIRLKSPVIDDTVEYKFDGTYTVMAPSATVSPTKMNVFYAGVDNPVEVSASGVPPSQVRATATKGSLIKSGKGYVFKINRPGGTTSIRVSANGRNLGTKVFRIKKVPDPVAKIAGKKGSFSMSKGRLKNSAVLAVMENFDFQLKFRITSFTVSATIGGYVQDGKSTNSKLTSKQKGIISKQKNGRKIIIEKIKARGPDGTTRKLAPLIITLK